MFLSICTWTGVCSMCIFCVFLHLYLCVVHMVKNLPAMQETGSITGLGRSPGGGNGNQLQYFCLEDCTDREAWRATVQSVQLSVVSNSLRPHGLRMPGFPVHHQLLELAQTHVHQVSDAIQPSHPLSSPSPPAFNLFQHQGLF